MPQEWIILKREDIRLRTFSENFTASFLSPLALAKAGFFYVGFDDQVQCAFCRGVVRDWELNDDPNREHQRLFPSCPFILGNKLIFLQLGFGSLCVLSYFAGLPVGNIPLGEDPSLHQVLERTASLPPHQTVNGFGVSRQFSSQLRPNASPDTGTVNGSFYFTESLLFSCTH